MNSAEIIFPANLWAARDSAIAAFCSGTTDIPAEKKLEGWLLSAKAYDQLVDGDAPIGMICDLRRSDDDVASQLGLDVDSNVSDQDRVEFAREAMENAREDTSSAYIEARLITSTSGQEAYIGLSSVVGGQGAMDFSWLGLYENPQSLVESLHNKGCAVDRMQIGEHGFNDYTDDEIVRLTRL